MCYSSSLVPFLTDVDNGNTLMLRCDRYPRDPAMSATEDARNIRCGKLPACEQNNSLANNRKISVEEKHLLLAGMSSRGRLNPFISPICLSYCSICYEDKLTVMSG